MDKSLWEVEKTLGEGADNGWLSGNAKYKIREPSIFDLSGRVAVVTGGSGRVGPIWIETLENAGAKVLVLDLPAYDVSKLDQVYEFQQMLPPDQMPTIVVNSAAIDNPPGSRASFFGNSKR